MRSAIPANNRLRLVWMTKKVREYGEERHTSIEVSEKAYGNRDPVDCQQNIASSKVRKRSDTRLCRPSYMPMTAVQLRTSKGVVSGH